MKGKKVFIDSPNNKLLFAKAFENMSINTRKKIININL